MTDLRDELTDGDELDTRYESETWVRREAVLQNPAELLPIVQAEVAKAIVGQEKVIEFVLVSILARGHLLLEGNPKTLPHEHGKDSLEELFIAVAREPLSLEVA